MTHHWPHVLPLLVPVLAVTGVFLPDLVRAQARRSGWLLTAALASVASAVVHLAVAPEHFEESAVYGVFFVVLGLFQLAYAGLVLLRPTRRSVVVGVLSSCGAVALWAVTRTTGLPFGPFAWQPEGVGPLDLIAVTSELLVVLALARTARGPAVAVPRVLVTAPSS